jgi:UDP-glucose-4-epimerase GalE
VTTLVTGGAGYIGSHTVRHLRAIGRDVVVLDSLELGHAESLLGAPLVVGDIADRELVEATIRDHGVDSIVHFAAYKSVEESMRDPWRYVDNNVSRSAALIDTAASAGVERFVFSSSCSVYGTVGELPVSEQAAIAPESVYAETKASTERLLHWYGELRGLRSLSLRYFNAAGAADDAAIGEDWSQSANLVPLVMKAALGIIPHVRVFGTDYPTPDGTAVRDYIHVDDLAVAHGRALEALEGGVATTAVNVGTGVGSSVWEVLAAVRDVTGEEVPHVIEPRRAGDPVALYSDTRRAEELLGWRATRDLHDIVRTALAWHRRAVVRDGNGG